MLKLLWSLLVVLPCLSQPGKPAKAVPWFSWHDVYSTDFLSASQVSPKNEARGVYINGRFGKTKIHRETYFGPVSASMVEIDHWSDHPAQLFLLQTEYSAGKGGTLFAYYVRDHKLLGSYEIQACPEMTPYYDPQRCVLTLRKFDYDTFSMYDEEWKLGGPKPKLLKSKRLPKG